ncbi:hypothetical protein BT69DRAFT_1323146, partial [Atractiella rhizophila]
MLARQPRPTITRRFVRFVGTQDGSRDVSSRTIALPPKLIRKRALKDLRFLLQEERVKSFHLGDRAHGFKSVEKHKEEVESWERRLELALRKEESDSFPSKTVVLGDAVKCKTIVTALLEDTLASDQTNSRLLRSRSYTDLGEGIQKCSIGYSTSEPSASDLDLQINDPWLNQSNIQIQELHLPDFGAVVESPDTTTLSSVEDVIYGSEAVVLCLSGSTQTLLQTHLSPLLSVLRNFPQLYLVLEDASPVTPSILPNAQVLQISTQLLAEKPGDISSLSSSGLTKLKDVLSHISSSSSATPFLLSSALQFTSNLSASQRAWLLEQREAIDRLMAELLGKEKDICQVFSVDEDGSLVVDDRLFMRSKEVLGDLLDKRFAWFKLFWRSDDLGVETKSALEGLYLRTLEVELSFQLGYLSSQSTILKRTIDSHSSYLLSPALLSSLPPFPPFTPYSLYHPLQTRRVQLSNLLSSLHRKAQLLLIRTYSLSFMSLALPSSAYWVNLVEPSTSIGTASFGVMGSAWLLERGWRKAKRRFWGDWERIGKGVEMDL